MNDALAHQRLTEIIALIDDLSDLYNRRWGHGRYQSEQPGLTPALRSKVDEARSRVKLAQGIAEAMGEAEILSRVVEHAQTYSHSYGQARSAIVEAAAIIAQREELAEVAGSVGPKLAASELNATIWGSSAKLWDDGHLRAAVQTAATALEGVLQGVAGPGVSGEGLGLLFSISDPAVDAPRLRLREIDPTSKTWKSAHEGAAALVRGAFMGVRNLVSHPGWPEPEHAEALEMISVLSYVANLVDRSDVERVT